MASVLQGKTEGKRKRGRPSVSSLSNLRGITNMDVGLMIGNTRDREKWRKIVNSVAATIGPGDADERMNKASMKDSTMSAILKVALLPVSTLIQGVEALLFLLVRWYDRYMYSPLQTALWPLVERVPRSVNFKGQRVTVFTANIVTWSRTLLVIPIAYTLKYDYYWTGFWLVIFHDFLDHLDGIVAKVQSKLYGQLDDPIVGGFMDAFCDKIVNVLSLWSILLVTDFSMMSPTQAAIYFSACSVIIVFEFVLGIVRVQDFFRAYYYREFKKVDVCSSKTSTSAVMEGKAKEKLESMGIASLCLAQASTVAMASTSGIVGVVCLLLSVRLAHSSLMAKLQARERQVRSQAHGWEDEDERKSHSELRELKNAITQTEVEEKNDEECWKENLTNDIRRRSSVSPESKSNSNSNSNSKSKSNLESDLYDSKPCVVIAHAGRQDDSQTHLSPDLKRCQSFSNSTIFPDSSLDTRVERIYTIGCFDLFHFGHRTLMERMRALGKKVIIGVHDSRSIYQLKKRVPIDSTTTRMRNVKQYADEVFCVAGTDPTPFIECIFDDVNHNIDNAMYVRGDDMPQFPARQLCERLMTVKFLPYTSGVSSTKLRKDLLNSTNSDSLRLDDNINDLHMFY